MILPKNVHVPVLLREVLEGLSVRKGKKYIDATVGGGGYLAAIVKSGGMVLGIDADSDAILYAKKWLSGKDRYFVHGNFSAIRYFSEKYGFTNVSGIVFDLGVSSNQLEYAKRGFSYLKDEPLDLRFDKGKGKTAKNILNTYSKEALYEIFSKYSEELYSGAIAEATFRARRLEGEIERTGQLVGIITGVLNKQYAKVPPRVREEKIRRSIARIFQSLRIEVNEELVILKRAISDAIGLLEKGGKLCVVTFHSLEDRIVKTTIKEFEMNNIVRNMTQKPILPSREEITRNRRSHSAKLRMAMKL
ncbi:16S rRNA (cytosine(1402)-N(4))-methyltransferase RsmH [Candidatus Gottesmanbacteria bacterium]|nr:16S rRNA (cytosine(1402)-N(4))-methyltransferase RsmH [Candidatus Gottesmanbacteria bacterium]